MRNTTFFFQRNGLLSVFLVINTLCACFVCYLQLLLLEHARFRCVEDVVSQLSLAVYVDRCRGFTGQEAVVDISGTLGKLIK